MTRRIDAGILERIGTMGSEMQTRSWDERMYFEVAKIHASMNRFPEAVRYLRRALEDGTNEFGKIKKDPDLLLMAESLPVRRVACQSPGRYPLSGSS